MRLACLVVTALLTTATGGIAQLPGSSGDNAGALATHRSWWRAFTMGDTITTALLSSPSLSVTLSTAETYDRAAAVAFASQPRDSSRAQIEWTDESVRLIGGAAIITSRMLERIGGMEGQYRFLTALEWTPAGWRVGAAQSTRILTPSQTVALTAPVLKRFEGEYRVPNGSVLRVVSRDSVLVVMAPDGSEQILAPVSETVFEIRTSRARFDVVRFVFEREGSGRVTHLTRLAPGGVTSFPRAE